MSTEDVELPTPQEIRRMCETAMQPAKASSEDVHTSLQSVMDLVAGGGAAFVGLLDELEPVVKAQGNVTTAVRNCTQQMRLELEGMISRYRTTHNLILSSAVGKVKKDNNRSLEEALRTTATDHKDQLALLEKESKSRMAESELSLRAYQDETVALRRELKALRETHQNLLVAGTTERERIVEEHKKTIRAQVDARVEEGISKGIDERLVSERMEMESRFRTMRQLESKQLKRDHATAMQELQAAEAKFQHRVKKKEREMSVMKLEFKALWREVEALKGTVDASSLKAEMRRKYGTAKPTEVDADGHPKSGHPYVDGDEPEPTDPEAAREIMTAELYVLREERTALQAERSELGDERTKMLADVRSQAEKYKRDELMVRRRLTDQWQDQLKALKQRVVKCEMEAAQRGLRPPPEAPPEDLTRGSRGAGVSRSKSASADQGSMAAVRAASKFTKGGSKNLRRAQSMA
eukprot:CAMPEP_0182877784 /NCGR_PEP_ID=MMETSP0034_2-20130328/14965_1 /TAXON_ID=156128 /ORGANISM="Nephroselmis pyriformis, Strain CCMP717" /LENGTH=465 /DNA_ID=CAMNT_0025010647 /DNA_START=312 /DNA_END=1705 /DNA_ORIENTATION=-